MLPGGGTGPQLGAQFAQLVKELRSEYGGAVSAAAARIVGRASSRAPGRSILRILQQHGVTGTPALMQQQARGAQASALLASRNFPRLGAPSCAFWSSSTASPARRRSCSSRRAGARPATCALGDKSVAPRRPFPRALEQHGATSVQAPMRKTLHAYREQRPEARASLTQSHCALCQRMTSLCIKCALESRESMCWGLKACPGAMR